MFGLTIDSLIAYKFGINVQLANRTIWFTVKIHPICNFLIIHSSLSYQLQNPTLYIFCMFDFLPIAIVFKVVFPHFQ